MKDLGSQAARVYISKCLCGVLFFTFQASPVMHLRCWLWLLCLFLAALFIFVGWDFYVFLIALH